MCRLFESRYIQLDSLNLPILKSSQNMCRVQYLPQKWKQFSKVQLHENGAKV